MKNYIYTLFILCTLVFISASCERDALLTSLEEVTFDATIEATSSTIRISSENQAQSVVAISWSEVVYPVQAPVTYTLQLDTRSGTIGNTAWQNSVRVLAGTDVFSKSLQGDELNTIAISLGLQTGVEGVIVVRVASYLDRDIYSEAIELRVTPYEKPLVFGEIFMPGGYQDWDIDTAASLDAIDSGVYQGYVTYGAAAYLGFKLNNDRNWDQFYGAGTENSVMQEFSDTDFLMPASGSYQMNVNLNTLRWTATSYSWGIVGDATEGGWDNSTPMSYDHQLKAWTYTGDLNPGNVKFRLNNVWTINYGTSDGNSGDVTDATMTLDDAGAHYISEAGTYQIIFNIDELDPDNNGYPAIAIYTVTKI